MFMTGQTAQLRKAAMLGAGALVAGLLTGTAAQAQGQLTVYCGVQEDWCRPMVDAFEKADRHQGVDDPQELGRDLCAGEGRGGQSRAATSGGAARATRTCRRPRKA